MEPRDMLAAGAVVARKGGEVLLVHRPKYDDWSFPKGKLDPGEHVVTAAVREVAEETGVDVRLGPRLTSQRYALESGRMKTVAYWTARAIGSDDISRYRANDEIDRVEWVDWEKAADRLTYEHDRETLSQAHGLRKKTRALVVLRHGKARSRKAWKDDDRRRPLLDLGNTQAQRIVPVLAAFDVQAVHTSSSTRCVETVLPYSHTTGWPLTTYDSLSEEGADPEAIRSLVASLLESRQGAVLCSHRPVLPEILGLLGVEGVELDKGEMLVAHHRRGRVVATERYSA